MNHTLELLQDENYCRSIIRTASSDDLMTFLQEAETWDEAIVEPAARELCRRYNLNFDFYDTYDELYKELE